MFPLIGSFKEYKQGMYEFKVIPDEQTPEVDLIKDVKGYLASNKEKLEEYLEFARTRGTAVGLAANQCSIDGERFMDRLFAIKDMTTGDWRIVINPLILEYKGMEEIKSEGCLTWVGRKIVAKRSLTVVVAFYDTDGVYQEEEHSNFTAQIWQHEINHLDGVVERVVSKEWHHKNAEPYRNDKCPCGSGKKYKQCCLKIKQQA